MTNCLSASALQHGIEDHIVHSLNVLRTKLLNAVMLFADKQMLSRGVRGIARVARPLAPSLPTATAAASVRALSATARQPATEAKFPSVRAQTNLFIDGQFVPSVSGKTFKTYNPGNGNIISSQSDSNQSMHRA